MCALAAAAGYPRCCEIILQGNHTVPVAFRQILSRQSVQIITAGKELKIPTEEKDEHLRDFLKKINAILNAGFGFVLVHFDNASVMDLFNGKVNSRLDQMIADHSYFHENFVWKHYDENDEKHILFWVKQKHRKHVSTMEVNTKVSWNGSLRDAKPGQLRSHVKRALREEAMETDDTQTGPREEQFTFKEGEEVKIGKLAFQENIGREAKSKPDNVETSDLVNWLWEMEKGGKLPGYITAFAKLEDGGSYFVGIAEEKESPSSEKRTCRFICKEISPTDPEREHLGHEEESPTSDKRTGRFICEGISLTHPERKQLCHEEESPTSDKRTGRFICKGIPLTDSEREQLCHEKESSSSDKRTGSFFCKGILLTDSEREQLCHGKESSSSDKRTGRFICKGIPLTDSEREQLRHRIEDGVKKKMMWLTEKPLTELVSVHFHEVEVEVKVEAMQPRSQAAVVDKLYVMEVKVNHVDGIGFWHEDGPQAFTIMTAEDPVQADQTSTGEIAGAPKPGTSTGATRDGPQSTERGSKRRGQNTSSPIPEKMAPIPSAEPHPMAIAEWVKLNGGAERLAKLCKNSRLAL